MSQLAAAESLVAPFAHTVAVDLRGDLDCHIAHFRTRSQSCKPQPTSSEHERGWKAPGVVQSLDGALLSWDCESAWGTTQAIPVAP